MNIVVESTRRCMACGCPAYDHVPLRYPLRAWLLHMLPTAVLRMLRAPRRCLQRWPPVIY